MAKGLGLYPVEKALIFPGKLLSPNPEMMEVANRKRFYESTSARESMIGHIRPRPKGWVEKKIG